MSWKFRVYRGLHRGVEVELAEGRVVIGADPLRADLVFVDAGIAPEHLVLMVTPEGVNLVEWAAEVVPTQNGIELIAPALLEAKTRLEAGPLLWSFVDSSSVFPDDLEQRFAQPAKTSRKRNIRQPETWVGLLCLALFLGLLAIVGQGWWQIYNNDDVARNQKEIKRFLAAPAYRQVMFDATNPELLRISGYVDENSTRLALQQFLDRSGTGYRLDLRSMEDIRQGADFILQKFGYMQIQTRNGKEAGWLKLSGVLNEHEQQWGNIESLLKREVPGLKGIENQTQLAGSHIQRLDALLNEYGLSGQLQVRENGDRIELSGQLDDTREAQFQQLQRAFSQEFGEKPYLQLTNQSRPLHPDELDFKVRTVSLGRIPYVILANNLRYAVGSSTPDGIRIMAIREDMVVVVRGKQRFIIKLMEEDKHDDKSGDALASR